MLWSLEFLVKQASNHFLPLQWFFGSNSCSEADVFEEGLIFKFNLTVFSLIYVGGTALQTLKKGSAVDLKYNLLQISLPVIKSFWRKFL